MVGRVIVVIRAYPKELTEDFTPIISKIHEKIKESVYNLVKWEPVEIAFGYKALELYFIMPEDVEGGTEQLEELIKSVDQIDNIDVIYVTRVGE
ncbi:MAG: elongation factor 1-beta [Desulfurococcaceae archaeon]|jgi:elongation factor 1-beta|nr:elongation factor 1-beta [Desulfurococcaceae archaeon]